jgi:hypothetical protein
MHHQRSALAAMTSAIIGHARAGRNVACVTIGSIQQPAISAACSATMVGKWPRPDSAPPRARLAAACRADTASSATRSRQIRLSSAK